MKLNNVKISTTNDVPEGRGWIGDVKFMNLDIKKLEDFGWKPKYSSLTSVEKSISEIVK